MDWCQRQAGWQVWEGTKTRSVFVAIIALPKPTLTLHSSKPLKILRLCCVYFSAAFQRLNMQKPQGERSNSRAGWGRVQLPKGHSCAETSQSCWCFLAAKHQQRKHKWERTGHRLLFVQAWDRFRLQLLLQKADTPGKPHWNFIGKMHF